MRNSAEEVLLSFNIQAKLFYEDYLQKTTTHHFWGAETTRSSDTQVLDVAIQAFATSYNYTAEPKTITASPTSHPHTSAIRKQWQECNKAISACEKWLQTKKGSSRYDEVTKTRNKLVEIKTALCSQFDITAKRELSQLTCEGMAFTPDMLNLKEAREQIIAMRKTSKEVRKPNPHFTHMATVIPDRSIQSEFQPKLDLLKTTKDGSAFLTTAKEILGEIRRRSARKYSPQEKNAYAQVIRQVENAVYSRGLARRSGLGYQSPYHRQTLGNLLYVNANRCEASNADDINLYAEVMQHILELYQDDFRPEKACDEIQDQTWPQKMRESKSIDPVADDDMVTIMHGGGRQFILDFLQKKISGYDLELGGKGLQVHPLTGDEADIVNDLETRKSNFKYGRSASYASTASARYADDAAIFIAKIPAKCLRAAPNGYEAGLTQDVLSKLQDIQLISANPSAATMEGVKMMEDKMLDITPAITGIYKEETQKLLGAELMGRISSKLDIVIDRANEWYAAAHSEDDRKLFGRKRWPKSDTEYGHSAGVGCRT
ncbi:MAG: hypothetical protein P1U63_12080 [Coxiellaceae bacterium]|nr:hypothetical protein [Coxiellaceae bacterium]